MFLRRILKSLKDSFSWSKHVEICLLTKFEWSLCTMVIILMEANILQVSLFILKVGIYSPVSPVFHTLYSEYCPLK